MRFAFNLSCRFPALPAPYRECCNSTRLGSLNQRTFLPRADTPTEAVVLFGLNWRTNEESMLIYFIKTESIKKYIERLPYWESVSNTVVVEEMTRTIGKKNIRRKQPACTFHPAKFVVGGVTEFWRCLFRQSPHTVLTGNSYIRRTTMSRTCIVTHHKDETQSSKHRRWTNIVSMLPKLLMFIPVLLCVSLLCFAMSAHPAGATSRPVSKQVIAGISLKEIARLQGELVFTHHWFCRYHQYDNERNRRRGKPRPPCPWWLYQLLW